MAIYARGVKTKKYGDKIALGINVEKFTEFLQRNVNEKGWVNLTLGERDVEGEFGDTHYVTLYEGKKEGGNRERRPAPKQDREEYPETDDDNDDLPF